MNSLESNETGIGVCAYAMRQWVECDRSLFWLSHVCTSSPLFHSPFHHTRLIRFKQRPKESTFNAELCLRRLLAPTIANVRRLVCFVADKTSKHTGMPFGTRLVFFRLFPTRAHTHTHTWKCARDLVCLPTPLQSHTFRFSQLQRLPNIQDQHIFRTFWLTNKKRAAIFYRTLFIVFS